MAKETKRTIEAENGRQLQVDGLRHGARLVVVDAPRERTTDFRSDAPTVTERTLLGAVLLDRDRVRELRDVLTVILGEHVRPVR